MPRRTMLLAVAVAVAVGVVNAAASEHSVDLSSVVVDGLPRSHREREALTDQDMNCDFED